MPSMKAMAQRLWLRSAWPALSVRLGEPLFRALGKRSRGRQLDPSAAKRILIVRLDRIGDMVLSTSLLRELRRSFPASRITLLADETTVPLVARCPYVDEVLAYPTGRALRRWPLHHLHVLRFARRTLWGRDFDLALVPRWDVDYYHAALIAYLSGAPCRVGYSAQVTDEKTRLNRGYDRFLTHPLDGRTPKHEVECNLDLLRSLGGAVERSDLELWPADGDQAFAERLLTMHHVGPTEPLVALAPGASQEQKRWPVERFIEVGAWLRAEYGARLVVIGGRAESALSEEMLRALGDGVISIVGRASLLETAATLRRCDVFVGNDSGPMHVAVACSVPVIAVWCHPVSGSSRNRYSPTRFGPWGAGHRVLQPREPVAPCSQSCDASHAHCILGVTVEQVKAAIREVAPSRLAPRDGVASRPSPD